MQSPVQPVQVGQPRERMLYDQPCAERTFVADAMGDFGEQKLISKFDFYRRARD